MRLSPQHSDTMVNDADVGISVSVPSPTGNQYIHKACQQK